MPPSLTIFVERVFYCKRQVKISLVSNTRRGSEYTVTMNSLSPLPARITTAATVRDFTTNAARKVAPGPCHCGPVMEIRGRSIRLIRLPGETTHSYIAASKIELESK